MWNMQVFGNILPRISDLRKIMSEEQIRVLVEGLRGPETEP